MRRKRILWCLAAMAGVVMLVSLSAIGANKADVWKHDFTDAAKEAKQAARPSL